MTRPSESVKPAQGESGERRLLRMVCEDDDAIGTLLDATRAKIDTLLATPVSAKGRSTEIKFCPACEKEWYDVPTDSTTNREER